MKILTLEEVQEIYYSKLPEHDNDTYTPFKAIYDQFYKNGSLCNSDFMESLYDIVSAMTGDVLEWMFDVSGHHVTSILMWCEHDEFLNKYLQRYIDEKRFIGYKFYFDDIEELTLIMERCNVKPTKDMYETIQIRIPEPFESIQDAEEMMKKNEDMPRAQYFIYQVLKHQATGNNINWAKFQA